MSDEQLKLLDRIVADESLQNYFFSKVEDPKWFYLLKERGFFSPENMPSNEGMAYVKDWVVLPYLEKLSHKSMQNEAGIPVAEIINIMKEATQECDKNPSRRNYRIWWYFTKILCHLPPHVIDESTLALLPIWFNDENAHLLPTNEILGSLLPKFINLDNIKKAEQILYYVTDIKWVDGHSWREEDAKTKLESYWLSDLLIKSGTAKRIGELCHNDFIFRMANRLQDFFVRKYSRNYNDVECGETVIRVTVKLTDIQQCICTVGKVPTEAAIKARSILSHQIFPDGYEQYLSIEVPTCQTMQVFRNLLLPAIDKITDVSSEIKADIAANLEKLYTHPFNDYSFIWFKNLEAGERFYSDQADTTLVAILNNLIIGKSLADKDILPAIITKIKANELPYPVFKRYVLQLISEHWTEYRNAFWDFYETFQSESLFENPYYETDLHSLLRKNVSLLNDEDKARLQTIIESGPTFQSEPEYRERRANYWKQTWYSSLKADIYFLPFYDKYRTITNVEERDVFSEGKVTYGPGSSPKKIEELLEMSGKDLSAFLKAYTSENQWDGPNVDGLAGELVALFRDFPNKISDCWESFVDIPYVHMSHILRGLREAWEKKADVPWKTVLDLARGYIDSESFWNGSRKKDDDRWTVSVNWVIGEVCEVIVVGTKIKGCSFPPESIPAAEELLSIIVGHSENIRPSDRNDEKPTLDYALNSAMGKAVRAQINLFLHQARLAGPEHPELRWPDKSKNTYEKLLKDEIIEAYTYLGQCLPNFYFLDQAWAEKQIDEIIALNNDRLWQAFFDGYLYIGTIYPIVYNKMVPLYMKALSVESEDRADRLLEHITFAYLQKYETLDGPIFTNILKDWKPQWIATIVSHMWRHHGTVVEEIAERILDFWKMCYTKLISEAPDQRNKDVLSDLTQLTCFLKEVTEENKEWLLLSAPYTDLKHHSTFFIEYLNKLKENGERIATAKRIGTVYLKMLETATPEFRAENIQSIISFLFETKDADVSKIAEDICEIYGRRGKWNMCRKIVEKYSETN